MNKRLIPSTFTRSFVVCGLLIIGGTAFAANGLPPMMPQPAQAEAADGALALDRGLDLRISGPESPRLKPALERLHQAWARRFDQPSARGSLAPVFEISYKSCGAAVPTLGEDETYTLESGAAGLRLSAATDLGVLRGLATLTQLPRQGQKGWELPALRIEDRPRFAWRGLMLDVARHWMPMEVVLRNLDAMALVKLNVLHLHLTEDQGFRIESKTHPELHTQGSDGHYFTQDQIRTILREASLRGIRVVPEFDIPGHATSWVVSHPEIASLPGPYKIEREWGVFDPVLDPTKEETYALLGDFLGEMCALFPDAYLHIGGDENNGVQWSSNGAIQSFILRNQLGDNAGLHAYFNQRLAAILEKHGKRVMGWDEILHPKLPRNILIQSWRGPQGVADAAKSGCQVILSNGFYIDLAYPAADHYLNDPLPAGNTLTAEEQARVLGGEATMWAEWVTPETIDSRIWPRTAAVAERLWSPASNRDVPDMYRRLDSLSPWLGAVGSLHEQHLAKSISALAGGNKALEPAVRTLALSLEPLKHYRRGKAQPEGNQLAPMDTLADLVQPDAPLARAFRTDANAYLWGPDAGKAAALAKLRLQLDAWEQASLGVLQAPSPATRARTELDRQARVLLDLARMGRTLLDQLDTGRTCEAGWVDGARDLVERAALPNSSATEFRMLVSFRRLLAVAANPSHIRSLPSDERRALLERLVPEDIDKP
jgi:hexosaminidase